MFKIIKRLPPAQTLAAIAFLLIQIGCSLYQPYVTASIINNGVVKGDTTYIWSQGALLIGLSVLSLFGAIFNTLLFSRISYKLGEELRSAVYRKALKFAKNEFDKFGVSSLITRNTNDIAALGASIGLL